VQPSACAVAAPSSPTTRGGRQPDPTRLGWLTSYLQNLLCVLLATKLRLRIACRICSCARAPRVEEPEQREPADDGSYS